MSDLKRRIERLEATLGDVRERLENCLRVSERPQDAMALARGVAESLTKQILQGIGRKPAPMLDACLKELETPEVMSKGLVPAEIISMLHMVRVIGNKATHDAFRIEITQADVDLVMRSVLRVVEWYFAEFQRGPKVNPLFKAGVMPVAVPPPQLPPAVRMPGLTIVGADDTGFVRKVFILTESLLGLGREKTSRDPRIHVITRLLPCPGPSHANWNANLQNLGQFHAQIWWQMGRVEIRDENSDKGVLLNGRPIAPGQWTLCSYQDPARVRLGPEGVEFSVSEVIREVGGVLVPCVRLTRLGNWPHHEYLMVGRPLVTIGPSADCVVQTGTASDAAGLLQAGEKGWEYADARGVRHAISVTATYEADGLLIKRTTEDDFL